MAAHALFAPIHTCACTQWSEVKSETVNALLLKVRNQIYPEACPSFSLSLLSRVQPQWEYSTCTHTLPVFSFIECLSLKLLNQPQRQWSTHSYNEYTVCIESVIILFILITIPCTLKQSHSGYCSYRILLFLLKTDLTQHLIWCRWFYLIILVHIMFNIVELFSVFMPLCACAFFAPPCTFCKYLSVSLLILHQWQTSSPATLVAFFLFFSFLFHSFMFLFILSYFSFLYTFKVEIWLNTSKYKI